MRALLRHSCDVAKWAPVVARSRPVPDYGARVGTVDIVSEDLVFLAQTFGSGDVASGELRRASVVVRRLLNDAQLVQALKATGATEPLRLEAYPIEQALPHGGATSGILLAMAGGTRYGGRQFGPAVMSDGSGAEPAPDLSCVGSTPWTPTCRPPVSSHTATRSPDAR